MDRIAITGLGLVTPLGADVLTTWDAWLAGCSGIKALDPAWSADLPTSIGAPCSFDPTIVMPAFQARRLDPSSQMAVLAALQAWRQAGEPALAADRRAVVMGTGIGGLVTVVDQLEVLRLRGAERVNPLTVPMIMPNAAAAQVGLAIGATAAVHAPVAACAAGAEAIAWGLDLLRLGRADVVVVGGTEAILNRLGVAAFGAMRALSVRNDDPSAASRPYDRDRDGFVLGEGAGAMVLERESQAIARGIRPLGFLLGTGLSADAHHIAAPEPEGRQAEMAIRRSLIDAGLTREAVDLINAHATGTPLGDPAEALALSRLFEGASTPPLVTAPKGAIGHLIGAAGAVESVLTVLCLQQRRVPPTLNCPHPDERLQLPLVVAEPASLTAEHPIGINNSFGFGGHNVALVFQGNPADG